MVNLLVDFNDIVCSQNALHRIMEKSFRHKDKVHRHLLKIHPKVVHPFINNSAQTNTLQKITNGSKKKTSAISNMNLFLAPATGHQLNC